MSKEIVVHGGGFVGITGAMHAAKAGYKVIIYDPDQDVVDAINSGTPRAGEYLGYIDEHISKFVKNKQIIASTDFNYWSTNNIHFLAVPTEKNDKPYMKIVKDVIKKLSKVIPHNGLIIIESTIQPRTIDEVYYEMYPGYGYVYKKTELDEPTYSNIDVYPKNFFLAVCPRLDWFADKEKNLTNLPRIVGGINPESTEKAANILAPICPHIRKTHYRAAEMAKAGQNALYFTQIMAAYEMAERYQNFTDMNEALRLIGVHWRLPNLYLGPGTSGRCVAMGAKYICEGSSKFTKWDSLFVSALQYDEDWRRKIGDLLTKKFTFADSLKCKILVMGIAYSPNFSDFGYSAGLDIATYLHDHAWNVQIHDAVLPAKKLKQITKIPVYVPTSVSDHPFDAVLLATGHDAYKDLPPVINWKPGVFILDAVGIWEKFRKGFEDLGVRYVRVGEKGWLGEDHI